MNVAKTELISSDFVATGKHGHSNYVKALSFCNGSGEKLTTLQGGGDVYAVLDKTHDLYRQMKVEDYGTLTFIGTSEDGSAVVRGIAEVDGWILHKLDVDRSIDVGEFRLLKLNVSDTEWQPAVRAKLACQKIIEVLEDSIFSGHEVIKYKSKKDEVSIQLSGVVTDDLVKCIVDTYNEKNADDNLQKKIAERIICTRAKKSAKGQTTLRFITGEKLKDALRTGNLLLSSSKSLPIIFDDGRTSHGGFNQMCLDFKETKKRAGKLTYKVEPADICIFQKQEINNNVKLHLERAKSMGKLHYERIVKKIT